MGLPKARCIIFSFERLRLSQLDKAPFFSDSFGNFTSLELSSGSGVENCDEAREIIGNDTVDASDSVSSGADILPLKRDPLKVESGESFEICTLGKTGPPKTSLIFDKHFSSGTVDVRRNVDLF